MLSLASEMYLLIAIEEQDWVTTTKKIEAELSTGWATKVLYAVRSLIAPVVN